MADDNYFLCIIGAMERLWFHQIVLSSEEAISITLQSPSSKSHPPSSPSSFHSLLSLPPLPHEDSSPSPGKQVSSHSLLSLQGDPVSIKKQENEETPRRKLNLEGNGIGSHSPSPKTQGRSRKFRKQAKGKLQKSMSCKTLRELELEEVKGFMDLGFQFKKEDISPRMMSLVPGLQRLGNTQIIDHGDKDIEGEKKEEEEKQHIIRPYLSESWLVKRPDASPSSKLKISKFRSATHMKKHIRSWAKSVASEIHHL